MGIHIPGWLRLIAWVVAVPVLLVISIPGVLEDVAAWRSWLGWIDGDTWRWIFVALILSLLVAVNIDAIQTRIGRLISQPAVQSKTRRVSSESRNIGHAVAEKNEPKEEGAAPKRRKRPRITNTRGKIKVTGSQVELTQWVYPSETLEVICKVRRPDGKLDSTITSPTVGLASTILLVYPDDFYEAPPLAKGSYQVVWTESTWREIRRPYDYVTPQQHERYEVVKGSGEFTVR